MQIRKATEFDAPQIAALHAASWRIAYRGMLSDGYLEHEVERDRLTFWESRLSPPRSNQHVLVAERGDEVVAFVCLVGASDPVWGTLVDNLHVHQSLKRRGIGALLMKEAAVWCEREHPSQGVYLWVLEPNVPAQAFYERMGARNAERGVWVPPDGGAVPKFRFVWPSPQALAVGAANSSIHATAKGGA